MSAGSGGEGRPAGDATECRDRLRACAGGKPQSRSQSSSNRSPPPTRPRSRSAAKRVKNSEGKVGKTRFKIRTDYHPFRLKDGLPVVKRAIAAVSENGTKPNVRVTNGGLDANWMVRHGVPTVTFGAGQNEAHTVDEWVNLDEFERACTLAVRLATMR